LAVAAGDGSFEGAFTMSSLDVVGITGTLLDGEHAAGTLRFQGSLLSGGCEAILAWGAQVPPPPTPTATAEPPAPSPTSAPQPTALPQAGGGRGEQFASAPMLLVLAASALLGVGAGALGGALRRGR
jgi:hypothetical protein